MHWRYACPECGSVSIKKVHKGGANQINKDESREYWYCKQCCEHYTRRYDKKKDQLVAT